MSTVGLFGALVAGILSLISPCSALLLPAFFAYAFSSLHALLGRTLVFLAGLLVVLVPLGAGAGTLGAVLAQHRPTLILVGGWLLIALGVWTALGGGFRIPGLSAGKVRGTGAGPILLLGMVYGFAGFCAGPLLGAVLTTAAVGGSALYGGLVLGVYALGMALPLFVLAALWDRFDLGSRALLRSRELRLGRLRTTVWGLVSGGLFIGVGWLFIASHGSANLPGPLNLDARFEIEAWATRVTGAVSDVVFWFWVALVGVVVTAVVLIRQLRRREDAELTAPADGSSSRSGRPPQ